MPLKVKRGLGLLTVAAIGYLLVYAAQGDESVTPFEAGLEMAGYSLVAVGLFGGLALLAWGLLRE